VEIVLIRHGEPEWRRNGLAVSNPVLTERGHEQARRVARVIAAEHFDEVLCSPLVRARQTAAPIFEALGRPEQVADWLEEMRDPDYDGQPGHLLDALYTSGRQRPSRDHWHGLPGGESMSDFVVRIRTGADAFLAERGIHRVHQDLPVWHIPDPTTRVALVAHGGTNTVTLCHLLGVEPTPWDWERFLLFHASITRIQAIEVGDGWLFSVRRLSDVEHLPAELRTH
jgi:probable phosphoglycerate mutase